MRGIRLRSLPGPARPRRVDTEPARPRKVAGEQYREIAGIWVQVRPKRVRSFHLHISPPLGQVWISVPPRTTRGQLEEIITKHLDWIAVKQNQMAQNLGLSLLELRELQAKQIEGDQNPREGQRAESPLPPELLVRPGSLHPVWGEYLPLRLQPGPGPASLQVAQGELVLCAREPYLYQPDYLQRALGAWYREQTQARGREYLEYWGGVMGLKYRELKVRRMKSKWGSCQSQSAVITLNSQLAKREPRFLEMVVIHELVHLRVPNHSAEFGRQIEKYLPDWRKGHRELNALPPNLPPRLK